MNPIQRTRPLRRLIQWMLASVVLAAARGEVDDIEYRRREAISDAKRRQNLGG